MNTSQPNSIAPTFQEFQPIQINEILEKLIADFSRSKELHSWGIDDEMVQSLKKFLENPFQNEYKKLERSSNTFMQLFLAILVSGISHFKLDSLIDGVTYTNQGTEICLWIFLKPEQWSFENRRKFYPILSSIMNVPLFNQHSIDYRIVKKGTINLPESYKQLQQVTR
jgi:hypothetical protein